MNSANIVNIEIVCRNLPDPTALTTIGGGMIRRVGIQEGTAIVQDVPFGHTSEEAVIFRATLVVKGDGEAMPDFGGKFVHGKKGERFLYLNWGDRDPTTNQWVPNARTKITLTTLTAEAVDAAQSASKPLVLTISLTNDKGKLRMASLPKNEILWGVGDSHQL